MTRRPKIGITMRLELATGRFYLGRDYGEAVEAAGGVPVHIALIPKAEYIAEVMKDLDGLLLPGSNTDLDPRYYSEDPHPALGTVIPEKDETDRLVLAEAERLNIPILGICYGMQALNVYRGGGLIQDIATQVDGPIKHEQGMPATRNSHWIMFDKESFLGSLDSVQALDEVRVNSSHHQAVRKVGKGLEATAWTSDGVVECIEDMSDGRFILGVQWHPELTTAHEDGVSREIFQRFVERCAERGNNSAAKSV
jgi:putative glutamine amidotransferase